ncbi:MAG TPA: GTP cyclohydrolase II [Polyangiaceae bacterium]|jgi:GTP cyclohydrolase II|nr:GTP cyclohydrolase II [Polyangiaceae bacterium]
MHVPKRVIRPHETSHAQTTQSERQAERMEPLPTERQSERDLVGHERDHGTRLVAKASIPTRYGDFDTHVFRARLDSIDDANGLAEEHLALVRGDVRGRENVLIRVHSECMTSEVFGSLKCDCKEQLDAAMGAVASAGLGAVLYLRQEGRGIGLTNKIRAYALQSDGFDTVDANARLGLPIDARRYDVVREMLDHLGIESVRLLTNNPAKVAALRKLGVRVVGRVPIVVPSNPHSARYLETKRVRMDHDLPVEFRASVADAE